VIHAWCFREPGTQAEPIPEPALAKHAADPDCLLWVDCDQPTTVEIDQLRNDLELHALTAEDLIKAGQRTKLDRYGDYFHVALHDCVMSGDALVDREVDVVFSDGWLLSVRHNGQATVPAPLIDALTRFERQRGEDGSKDEGFLLWAILDVIVDRYFDVIAAFDDRLDAIEDVVFDAREAQVPREIFVLRRSIVAFRRVVGPLREVLAQLLRREVPGIGDAALTHLQDVYDHTLRVLDLVESQRELLTGLLEGQLAMQSNQMSRVMKATSSWGAILIAATLIAGVYGMNFTHMPELDWRFGYPFALGLMGIVTIVLYRIFKRQDWL
jgi:magnesium transporter